MNMNTQNWFITGFWLVGFIEAEGCFSIYYDKTNKNFKFELAITQKEDGVLTVCKAFLQDYAKSVNVIDDIGEVRPSKGADQLRIMKQEILLKVMKPFFRNFPLYSSKWNDYLLFFAALELYVDRSKPRNVCYVYVMHIMYSMNTKGGQRKKTLKDMLNQFKPMFNNESEWSKACKDAQDFVKSILAQGFSTKELTNTELNEYFTGIICGDGCFHADFDLRENRKATVSKALSISLPKTTRNEVLLDDLAKKMGFVWTKRPSAKGRHNFEVEQALIISSLIVPFFNQHFAYLTPQKQKHFLLWSTVDKLLGNQKSSLNPSEIEILIQEIYYSHANGIYRNYPVDYVVQRFISDWWR